MFHGVMTTVQNARSAAPEHLSGSASEPCAVPMPRERPMNAVTPELPVAPDDAADLTAPAADPAVAAADPAAASAAEDGEEGSLASRLNWLRAGVLGANDGIVSVAAVVVGVAGATRELGPILTAGAAAVVGGAVSMALGEYVSVSSQRDALIARREAGKIVEDDEIVSPWHAAFASAIAFLLGSVLPVIAICLPPANLRVIVAGVATLVALALTGTISAAIGGGSKMRAAVRVVAGGALALVVTYAVGALLGSSGVI